MPNNDTTIFVEKAKRTHGGKYDYSKTVYEHSKKQVEVVCPIHGSFMTRPNNHLNGQGCPKCGRTKKLTREEFIEKSRAVHGDKYDYSKVEYVNSKTKVTVICGKHGEFKVTPNSHMGGVGCKKCHFDKLSRDFSMTRERFVEKANKIHGGKYKYGDYNGYDEKMEIICPIHGKFLQTPHGHLSGFGCKKCSSDRQHDERAKGFSRFVDDAEAVHGKKYKYVGPYVNKETPIEVVCPIHGSFMQKPKIHLRGCGCPMCASSHLENEVMKALDKENIDYVYNCKKDDLPWIGRQHLDFYLPKYNTAIECQGSQHYVPSSFGGKETNPEENLETIRDRDDRKRRLCNDNNVRLLYFSDKKWNDNVITDKTKLIEEVTR